MPRKIFFDIETLPPAEAEREHYRGEYEQFLQTQSYKDNLPTFEEYFRSLALDAATGRVLTIGLILEANGKIIHKGCLGRERTTGKFHLDERRTIGKFWDLIRDFNFAQDLIIGHNAIDFDMLFLLRRSAVLQITPTQHISLNKYRNAPVFDTMWEWTRGQRKIKLSFLAQAMRLPDPKDGEIDGSKIYDAFLAGRDHEIAAYCLRDVECTRQIYYRMNFLSPPDTSEFFQPVPNISPEAALSQ